MSEENYTILFDEEQNVVEVRYQGVNAALLAEVNARLTALEAEFDLAISGVDGQLGSLTDQVDSLTTLTQANAMAITAEEAAREIGDINLNESFANEIITVTQDYSALIEAEAEARAQAVLDEATARGAAIASSEAIIYGDMAILATSVSAMATELGAATANIIEVNDALVTETAARVAQYTLLQADFGDTNASVLEESVARADEDSALGVRIDLIEVEVDDAYAAVLAEQTARIDADGVLASDITAVEVTANGAAAAVTTETSARIAADGTISGKYSVKVDVNGRVSGFDLISTAGNVDDTPFSAFNFRADAFNIYNGTSDIAPFSVTGGTVYMQDVVIQDATIENLTVSKLTSGDLDAVMNIGSGRIVFDNGSVMLVQGIGFGTTNQFIEWFGPSMDIGDCSTANSFSYKTITGDAYFGGTLSAGTLQASVTGTSLSATAEVTLGPYATNGDDKLIAFSYIYGAGWTTSGSGSTSGAISATIELYRKIGVGSETLVATLSPVGTYEKESESGTSTWTQSMSASTTYTDSDPSTDDRTYRAVITARTLGFSPGSGTHSQKVTIISTEEP